jgi:hypothetical protein
VVDRGRIWFEICAMEYGFSFRPAVQIGTLINSQHKLLAGAHCREFCLVLVEWSREIAVTVRS